MSPQEKSRLQRIVTSTKEAWTQQRKRLEAALEDSQKVLQEGDPFEMAMHLETVNGFYIQERNAYTDFKEAMRAIEGGHDLQLSTVAISGAV
ncbi:MAG: hypothetical protein DWQ07_06555 [Chloroflexi bacterium]|nr:MAG: hypothetical protein DWQ07_06555 [Chloroflexota bacterium]MBL1195909.1 hypothetical protein [Chloroflexota bacterium]NOH13202.1 hypothetical protein [Chloroflexota bacterium]